MPVLLQALCKLTIGFVSFLSLTQLTVILLPWYMRERVLMVATLAWVVPLVVLEILWLLGKRNPFPKTLTHLRYAPIGIMLFFTASVIIFDQAMVQYSRYQIRSYVYGETPPNADVWLNLHNTNRGWCGNGHSATIYSLYSETSAEGFSSADPEVRARSTRASLQVYDWLNGTCDGPFPELIRRAEIDEDPLVREMAEKFLKDRHNFCRLSRRL